MLQFPFLLPVPQAWHCTQSLMLSHTAWKPWAEADGEDQPWGKHHTQSRLQRCHPSTAAPTLGGLPKIRLSYLSSQGISSEETEALSHEESFSGLEANQNKARARTSAPCTPYTHSAPHGFNTAGELEGMASPQALHSFPSSSHWEGEVRNPKDPTQILTRE